MDLKNQIQKRTIKFRALKDSISDFRFIYGNLIYDHKDNPRIQEDRNEPTFTTCIKGTECQFTGLHDKNGKEIYMGDIVTYKRSVGNWTGRTMTTTHKIIFTEEINAFVMECGSSYIKLRKHWGYEYEVIGNIFENPALHK